MKTWLASWWPTLTILAIVITAMTLGIRGGWWPRPRSDNDLRERIRETCKCECWQQSALEACEATLQVSLSSTESCLRELEKVRLKVDRL